ncbi:MAG TPA: L-2-amino-thiazoline-4-carboxylic acid hydrolase [Methylocella sp.]|nr:L-2-amino-thiazoline-4-carboxylic acid hydrolase [Methylocella sp.]
MADSLLERRRIEAQFAKAVFDVLSEETSRTRTVEILSKAVIRLATEAGKAFASRNPSEGVASESPSDLLAYAEILALWQQDGALTIDLKVKEKDRLEFDVTRCRYAEMYRELGMADLGRVLSCNRDGAFCAGFDPEIRLTRTKTIMEGAGSCDFRYALVRDSSTKSITKA